MIRNRLCDLKASVALGCVWAIASSVSAQIVVQSIPLSAPVKSNVLPLNQSLPKSAPKHLGSGPIDMNNLPEDVLNCEVCRQRLGLPPLSKSLAVPASSMVNRPHSQNSVVAPTKPNVPKDKPQLPDTPPVPMLGSPGLISSTTASQMEALGQVVEEFKPPQPQSEAIQLGEIPPEARQQFMKSLDLPAGAKVMSAEVKGIPTDATREELPNQEQNTVEKSGDADSAQPGATAESTNQFLFIQGTIPAASSAAQSERPAQGTEQANSILPAQDQAAEFAKKKSEMEKTIAELTTEREALVKERAKLKKQFEEMQTEWLKRMAQADAANREALSMLEKRTAEMSEVQLQLKELKEALAKTKAVPKE